MSTDHSAENQDSGVDISNHQAYRLNTVPN